MSESKQKGLKLQRLDALFMELAKMRYGVNAKQRQESLIEGQKILAEIAEESDARELDELDLAIGENPGLGTWLGRLWHNLEAKGQKMQLQVVIERTAQHIEEVEAHILEIIRGSSGGKHQVDVSVSVDGKEIDAAVIVRVFPTGRNRTLGRYFVMTGHYPWLLTVYMLGLVATRYEQALISVSDYRLEEVARGEFRQMVKAGPAQKPRRAKDIH